MKKTLYMLYSAAMALLMTMPTWAADPEPDQFTIVNHRLCEGDSLLIRDGWKKIKETTVFWETLKSTVTGEDSMIKHVVNVLPTYRHIEEKTIKDGETYTWNGQTYHQQGEYTYPLKTVEGCDSICVLRLFVMPVSHPIPFVEESAVVCQPEGYLWRGVNRYVTGTYYDTVRNATGEDTVYCLRLQAYPKYEIFQPTVYFCDGDSVIINGQVFKQSGEYRDTVKSSHGCDSVLVYPINKYPAFTYNEERTIQTGDMLLWHGQSLQSEGTYYDKLQTIHGCDSTYILVLHVNPATRPIPLVETFAETCRQDGYVWRDKSYYSEGIYYDTIHTGVGEDTIYCLHLTIYPTYELHQTLSFCQGGSIEINGHVFTQPGEYRDTLNTIHGCDSIIIYHLNTYPIFQHTEEQTIQAGDVLIWRGQTLQSEGTYYDKYQTIYGCDSIYTLILHVNPAPRPTPLVETFAETCKQEGYEWRNHLYFNEGVYYDTVTTGTGEDTIYCLHLTVYPTYELHQALSFCQGSSLEFRGKKFTEPGEYRDTLNSIYGCDSIIIYHINTYPTFHQYDTIVITDQDQRTWHGQQITESKTYYDSYTDIHGCDSVYQLYAIILPTYRYVLDTTICKNALPFFWRGQNISAEGTYTQKYESIYHTDSIYILNLTVHPTYWSIQNIYFCEGGEVTYAGKTYHQAGRDTLSFVSQYGCDSIVEVIVSERKKWMQSDTLRMSNQESRDWHGYHITKSGTYYDRLTNVDGCDSVYELVVYVFPTFLFEKDTAICQSEAPYLWQGMECSRLGTHTYDTVFKTIHGLDSIYRLTLTIWPEYEQTQQINICKGGSLEINGHIFTQAGEYRDTMRTIHGCDSVITYHVNMYPYFHHFDTIIITDQETYTWHGQSITTTGTYFDVNTDKHGCDSIYELFATVLPTYRFTLDTTVCQSTLPFTWRGKEIGRAGTYTDPLRSIYNTDSIYVLNVSLLPSYWNVQNIYFCEGGDVTFGGKTYTKSCRDTIRYGSSLGCDSVIEVVVNERRAWIQSDTVRMSNQETKLWRGQTITTSGIYYDRYNSVDGCDSIFELVVFVYPTYLFEEQATICQSEAPYIWRGMECSRLGTHTYEEVFKTIYGLDSIYRLTLTIWPEYEQTLQFNVCEGSYIEFEGNQCVSPGQYDFTLKTIHGCDSVIHVIVNSVSSYLFSDTVYINDYTPYTWPITGETYSEAGVYSLPGSTTNGCDSSYQLIIYKYPKYIMPVEQVELCMRDTDSFIWRGNEYNQTGVYYDSLFTTHGQDSIYTLNLVIHPIFDTIINATVCPNTTYMMNGKPYTESGTYKDTLTTGYGCDSIFTLNLVVLPKVNEQRFDTICETALPYTFYDQLIWAEGTYTYQFPEDQDGCNSAVTLYLTLRPDLDHNDSIIICHQDIPYILGDTSGEREGIKLYQDTIIYGCDNVHHFRLHVRNVKDSVVTMCDNDSLWLAGAQQWIHPVKGEVYYDTILSAPSTYSEYDAKVQCDSVIRYIIEGTYPSFNQDTIVRHINEQDSLFWAGQYRKSEGFYYDTLQTAACHCDSIITLHLIVDPITVYWDSIHICQPHDIAYRHIWADGHEQKADIWQPGTYIDSLRSIRTRDLYNDYDRAYRDSIYVLVVTMDPSYFFNSVYQLCQGDSVQFGSQWIHKAGIYTDSMKTYLGCDSIYRMVVNMTPSYYIREQKNIAQGTIYQWHGQSLSVPGVYFDSLKTQMYDCDSIYELTLDVYPTYHFRQDTAICACETPFLWHGQMIYTSGQYFDRHQTTMHFDSIYELNLQVRDTFHVTDLRTGCKDDSIYFNHRWITLPGEYYDTLTSTITGCDSIVRLIYSTFSTYFIP
ncbi:MAG: hypothetical protein MJZ59_04860, partial [Paludibacteraceae bacterium]|nr:hypothetical protein [Paludibacteraceae bacterium]